MTAEKIDEYYKKANKMLIANRVKMNKKLANEKETSNK